MITKNQWLYKSKFRLKYKIIRIIVLLIRNYNHQTPKGYLMKENYLKNHSLNKE
jgi:hypothetical protein